MMQPVQSNHAARVTLVKDPAALNLAKGTVTIDPGLLPFVSGLPAITVAGATVPVLAAMQVSNVAPAAGGFTFDAAWPTPFAVKPDQMTRVTVQVAFTFACAPMGMDPRLVEALTHIHLCLDGGDVAWVSSGDVCKACNIIAEMAPSPIVSDKRGDDLPLGRVVRLRLTALAHVGRTVILLAENDAGDGASYRWEASGGRVERIAEDIVAWTPLERPALIQAAVVGGEGAAVASYTWKEAA
jgi:hypothetical protein